MKTVDSRIANFLNTINPKIDSDGIQRDILF